LIEADAGGLGEDGGCARADQLFGVWAIEPSRFARLVDMAKGADLPALRKENRRARKEAALTRGDAGQQLYSVTADGIAQIFVSGPMTKAETSFQSLFGGTSTVRTRKALRSAARDPEVSGIMVVFDTPGGTIAGTSDLQQEIQASDARKPTYCFIEDLGASAGLYAASGGRRLFANRGAEVGSIGVYAVVYDTSGQYAKESVKVHVISSAPPLKGAGVDGTEITPAQLAEWERQVKDLADVFVSDLAAGRRMEKEKVQALATGQVWVADKALEHGLIDGVMSLDEAMRRLRSEAMNEQELASAKAAAATATAKAEEETKARAAAEAKTQQLELELNALKAKERAARFSADASKVGAPTDFAAVLDKIEGAVGVEIYGKLLTQLQAYNAQVNAGDLFKEKGSAGAPPSGATPMSQLEAVAKDLLATGGAKDYFTAFQLACDRNPGLVAQTRPGKEK
jgi:signal peptide peptidase SppA